MSDEENALLQSFKKHKQQTIYNFRQLPVFAEYTQIAIVITQAVDRSIHVGYFTLEQMEVLSAKNEDKGVEIIRDMRRLKVGKEAMLITPGKPNVVIDISAWAIVCDRLMAELEDLNQ